MPINPVHADESSSRKPEQNIMDYMNSVEFALCLWFAMFAAIATLAAFINKGDSGYFIVAIGFYLSCKAVQAVALLRHLAREK